MAEREDSLGVPLLDVPLRLVRGIRQVSNGAPFEAIQMPGRYEAANRIGEISERYGSQIQAIRQAAMSGAPESLPAAVTMLGAFRARALQDRVPAADFDVVFQGLKDEVSKATRAQLGLGGAEGATNVARQALMEGEDASKLINPLGSLLKNQAAAGLSNTRERRVRELLPAEIQAEEALGSQRGAAAYRNREQGDLYDTQRTDLVPSQVNKNNAQAGQADRSPRAPGGGDPAGKLLDDYSRNYDQLDRMLADQQNLNKTIPAPDGTTLAAGVQARVDTLNELGRQLRAGGYKFQPVEVRTETDGKGKSRLIVAPTEGDDASGAEWSAATGGGAAAAPPQSQGAPRGLPPNLGQPQGMPEPPAPVQIPELPPEQQMQAPGNVGDLSALLGPLAGQLAQGVVPKSQVRAQIASRGITDRAQQDAILGQIESTYGRANAAVGR